MKKLLLLLLLIPLLVSCQQFELTEEKASYDSVVFIGIDGAGSYLGTTSGFAEIFSSNSAWTSTATSEMPSASAQNWGSYLHGVSPQTHNCVNGSTACERFPYPQYPSVFKILREVYPQSKLASFSEWNAINYGLIEPSADVYKSSDKRFCSSVHSTQEIEDMTLEYLKNNTPTFLFVQLDNVDETGHSKGYGSADYLAEVQKAVDFVKKVDATIDYDKTLLIVATDHGGLGTNHGGDTEVERNITIAIKGKTITQQTLDSSVMPKDITPVILKALGVKKPKFMEGNIPEGITL